MSGPVLGASLIRSMGGKPYTVKRTDSGSYSDETGKWEPGTQEDITVVAIIQPLGGKEIARLPEADRTRERLRCFSDTELRTHTQDSGAKADFVTYNGKIYQVESVEPWPAYWKAILIKVEPSTLP